MVPGLRWCRRSSPNPPVQSINGIGFVTGALEAWDVILFLSDISGVDPQFDIGDAIAARRRGHGWSKKPFFGYPFGCRQTGRV